MMRIFYFLLFVLLGSPFFSQETTEGTKGISMGPIMGIKNPSAHSLEKSLGFDSTFIFTSDTIQLPFFDDFSTHKFQTFLDDFNNPLTTKQTYYRLLDATTNQPINNQLTYTNQVTFRRTYDINTGLVNDVNFTTTSIKENNLMTYPPVYNIVSLYPPYYIYDTVGVPDVSDTLWISNPSFYQDSASIFFLHVQDTANIWIDKMAYHNYRYGVNPRSLGVATFDGLDQNGYPYQFGTNVTNYGDFLTSKAIDLSNNVAGDSLYFSFLYQPEGFGDEPEVTDSLVLDFYAPDLDQWYHMWSVSGSSVHPFKAVHFPVLDAKFLKNGFKFRFKNYGALSGSLDHFHIDYVHLRALSSYNDTLFKDFALSYPISSLIDNYTSVPWDHYKATPDNKMITDLQIKVYNGSNSAENYQNGQINIAQNGVNLGNFTLPGIVLAEGQINYLPSMLFTSQHDLSTGFEYPKNGLGTSQTFEVTTTVSAQFPNLISNDSSTFTQGFYNYYSYDDGSAEAAFGPTGAQSMLAIHYNSYEADSLLGVAMHFVPSVTDVSNKLFYLTVWSESNGKPDVVLYEDDGFTPRQPTYNNGLNNCNIYYFPNGLKVPVGSSFFVGWRQVDAIRYNLGLDRNLDHSDEIFYSVDFGATWATPPFPGSAMMRPVFSTQLDGELGITETTAALRYKIYPNPSNGMVHVVSPFEEENGFRVFDLQGRLQKENNSKDIDLTNLPSGSYIIQSVLHPSHKIKVIKCD
jgi:hypothetical protein